MQRHARATADNERSPASAPQRREGLVTVLARVMAAGGSVRVLSNRRGLG